jgi:hypothetical protein
MQVILLEPLARPSSLEKREISMKKISIPFTVFLLAVCPSLPAYAAVGDAIWIGTRELVADLSGAQKSALATLINSDWGAGTAGQLDSEQCTRDLRYLNFGIVAPLTCKVAAELTLTDEAYFIKRRAGEIQPGQATTIVTNSRKVTADYSAWVLDVFGTTLEEIYEWKVWRDDDTPTTVHAAYWPIRVNTKTAFRIADSTQPTQVLKIIGEVAE